MARENVELVRYLLDQGADTENLDDKGCTLLHLACKLGIIDLYASIAHNYLSWVFFSYVLHEDPSITSISESWDYFYYVFSIVANI
jgi:ankyrin repeat protein